MANDLSPAIISFIIGGGLATLVGTAFKGISALRKGVHAEEREAAAELGEARRVAVRERRIAEVDAVFWMRISARYAAQLERAGIEPNPPNPVPPSERSVNGDGKAPRAAERA